MQDAPSLERKNATWRSESRWRVPRVSVSFGCNLYACGVCHQGHARISETDRTTGMHAPSPRGPPMHETALQDTKVQVKLLCARLV